MLEPLRFAFDLRPEWIAFEQVPPVLDLWQAFAEHLRYVGYSAWAGVLNAADFGVPQTRRRAFLLASRVRQVNPPEPTHAPPGETESLFGSLAPWVTMAQALGWGMTARPYLTVACSSETGGPDMEKVGGSGARRQLYDEQASGRWQEAAHVELRRSGERIEEGFDPTEEPAQTVTSRTDRWQTHGVDRAEPLGPARFLEPGTGDHRRLWDADAEPAPTMAFGNDYTGWKWHAEDDPERRRDDELAGPVAVNTGRDWKEGGSREDAQIVPADQPAPAIDGKGRWRKVYADQAEPEREESEAESWPFEQPSPTIVGARRSDVGGLVGRQLPEGEGRNVGGRDWPAERPATTVCADPRIPEPGWRGNPSDYADTASGLGAGTPTRSGEHAIRVTIEEAATLQGFPSGYPFQGTKSAKFRQVGNAVPPPLAAAVLAGLADLTRGG